MFMVIPNGARLKPMTIRCGYGSIGYMYTARSVIECFFSRMVRETGKFLHFWQEIDPDGAGGYF